MVMMEAASGMSNATKTIINMVNTLRRYTDCVFLPVLQTHESSTASVHDIITRERSLGVHHDHIVLQHYGIVNTMSVDKP
jgi:hypothetical protein